MRSQRLPIGMGTLSLVLIGQAAVVLEPSECTREAEPSQYAVLRTTTFEAAAALSESPPPDAVRAIG
jgi:hypothetical protein